MKLHHTTADVLVPDERPLPEALARITHLGIGAHQDDLEFMAVHGILACAHDPSQWFGGVTCTNGAGSPRSGAYAHLTDDDMQAVRRREQRVAAEVGDYGIMVQLDHSSATIKEPADLALKGDLETVLRATRPDIVYTHNPADKHDTHIGVAVATIEALRALPEDARPGAVWGCEGWRDLDWLPDDQKVVMDVSAHENLAAALNGVFDSQIAGGKRYDLAVQGRRRANATFFASHATDEATHMVFAMDLTPLIVPGGPDVVDYTCGLIDRFKTDVEQRLKKRLGG